MNFFSYIVFLCVLLSVGAMAASSSPIKHVIVVMQENRAFDHMLGWYRNPASNKPVNGLTGNEFNYLNSSDPNSQKIFVNQNASLITPCDPNHGTPETTDKIFGMAAAKANNLTHPTMQGFVEFERIAGNAATKYCRVMDAHPPEHLPVMTTLADEFVLMDRFFAAVPGPTWPNRLFALAASSGGDTETGNWYNNTPGLFYPMTTIFDQVAQAGLTWKNYYNDTPWELMLESIAKHPENTQPMDAFFEDCRQGTLPNYAWINPRSGVNMTTRLGSNDQHPDHDVSLGEAFYKDIYEALRSSPQWNETLMVITYDEHGGFYDHVPPPMGVPPPNGHPSYPDKGFQFDRLGIRLPTLLISPWLPKGYVESAPPNSQRPQPNSEYDLTSILSSARKLLPGMSTLPPLTNRDAWSATFEHLFQMLPEPRTDCPVHLPDSLPPTHTAELEGEMPVNHLQEHILQWHALVTGVPYPTHITKQKDVSSWVQQAYTLHRAAAPQTSDTYSVKMVPTGGSNVVTSAWTIRNHTVSAKIPSTRKIYCLGTLKSDQVVAQPCTLAAPKSTELWTYQSSDLTLRPNQNTSLCVTCTMYSDQNDSLLLRPCTGDVSQHFGYMGGGFPGMGGESGSLYIGAYAASVAIVKP